MLRSHTDFESVAAAFREPCLAGVAAEDKSGSSPNGDQWSGQLRRIYDDKFLAQINCYLDQLESSRTRHR